MGSHKSWYIILVCSKWYYFVLWFTFYSSLEKLYAGKVEVRIRKKPVLCCVKDDLWEGLFLLCQHSQIFIFLFSLNEISYFQYTYFLVLLIPICIVFNVKFDKVCFGYVNILKFSSFSQSEWNKLHSVLCSLVLLMPNMHML